jgi:hypothetical protein
MSSNNTTPSLVPLNEYILSVFSKFLLSKDFAFDREMTKKYDGSLTLVNYKPMATSTFDTSPGYMPFIIQISTSGRKRKWKQDPFGSTIEYGEWGKLKSIPFDEKNIVGIIEGYGFTLYYKFFNVNVVQGGTNKELISEVLILYPESSFGKDTPEDRKLVETKIKSLIQALQSANPTIRDNFDVIYTIHTSSKQDLYPHIILIPKGLINDISDFLLSQYQQIYGNITLPPTEFTPNENIKSPELEKFLEKLPLDLYPELVIGTYGSSPAVLLPEGNYSQYLTGKERVVNLGKNVVIVFGNPQEQQNIGTPQGTPQQVPAPQAQEQQNNVQQNVEQSGEQPNQVANSITEQNNLEKILNIELSPYIPDWLKPYLTKSGIKQGESLSRKEREEFAEKVWNELQKNWNRILELLDEKNASLLPTTVLALVTKFPSEYKASSKKVTYQSGNVIEQTTRSVLSNVFAELRQNYLIPLLDSFAPDQVLDLRVIRPLSPDEFERYQKDLSDIVKLYKDAYLVFSFTNLFKDKSYNVIDNIQNLKQADPQKLKYLQDLVDAFKELHSRGLSLPLIVDKNNTLLVGSVNELSPDNKYAVIRINDFDLNQTSEEKLKEYKSLLNFAKKAFDDQYGALIVKTTISPSTLDMQVFKTIVKLLGICSEEDEICLYKARQELSAFPESLKDKFIDNVAKETGRNPKYRIQLINLFATLFALVNYYDYLSELEKQELMSYGIRKLRESEEEKAKKILEMVKEGFKIS